MAGNKIKGQQRGCLICKDFFFFLYDWQRNSTSHLHLSSVKRAWVHCQSTVLPKRVGEQSRVLADLVWNCFRVLLGVGAEPSFPPQQGGSWSKCHWRCGHLAAAVHTHCTVSAVRLHDSETTGRKNWGLQFTGLFNSHALTQYDELGEQVGSGLKWKRGVRKTWKDRDDDREKLIFAWIQFEVQF